MIEFTLSRVVLCACGVILIASVTGVLNGIYDTERDSLDEDLTYRFAYMLDIFQSSDDNTLILDGSRMLPEGYSVYVHGGFVELLGNGDRQISATKFPGEFLLEWGDTITVTRRTSLRSS